VQIKCLHISFDSVIITDRCGGMVSHTTMVAYGDYDFIFLTKSHSLSLHLCWRYPIDVLCNNTKQMWLCLKIDKHIKIQW